MRSDLVAAIFLIVAAIVTVRYWEMRAPENHGQTQQEFSDEAAASKHSIYKRSVKIRIGQNQQYFTQAEVNSRSLPFLIDTGAAFVALRESDLQRAGMIVRRSDFTQPISTANGQSYAARVELDEVEINGISVRNVDAFVLHDEQLDINLLGMSFLSKLSRFETRNGEMTLTQ